MVTGLILITSGLGSRATLIGLALVDTFYGLFGIIRLGVALDLLLVAAAIAALGAAFRSSS